MLVLSVVIDIGLLSVFKYTDFHHNERKRNIRRKL